MRRLSERFCAPKDLTIPDLKFCIGALHAPAEQAGRLRSQGAISQSADRTTHGAPEDPNADVGNVSGVSNPELHRGALYAPAVCYFRQKIVRKQPMRKP